MGKFTLKRVEPDHAVKKLSPEVRELSLDLAQFTLDLLGIADQSGAIDLTNAVISIARQDWWSAAINVVSAFPIFGDAAKAAKIPKYQKTFVRAIELALKDADVCKALLPYFVKIRHVLEKVPGGDNVQILSFIKRHLDDFFKQLSRVGEVILREPSIDKARNSAVRLVEDFMGKKGNVQLQERMFGTMKKSDYYGKEIGAKYRVTDSKGVRTAEVRIDYDPQKGPHYNVTLREGGNEKNFAILFPATDKTQGRLVHRRTPR
ncbi:MAG: hypothetical protein IPK82_38250 [Polyangiaceae bacterium]|nr:hypothetical protein [Polyangiaceae bacterium]